MTEQTKSERIRSFLNIAAQSPIGENGAPDTELAQTFILKALPNGTNENRQRHFIGFTENVAAQVTGASFQTQVDYETMLKKIADKQKAAATALREAGIQLGL